MKNNIFDFIFILKLMSNSKSIPYYFTILITVILSFYAAAVQAQEPKESKWEMMKDTLDGKLDLTQYIIKAHGLIPIPFIITQPALGSFGLGFAPVLLSPKKRPEGYKGYIPPDITAGFGMYTANDSWAVGAGRIGSFLKPGIKYRAFFGYADINMSYYQDLPNFGTKEFEFNITATPIFLQVSKKLFKSESYLGVQYIYSKNVLKPNFKESLPEFVTSKTLDSNIGSVGLFLDRDTRNTIFTPDKGIKMDILCNFNANWTGSDYVFQKFQAYTNWFFPIRDNWISGLHFDYQQVFGDTPFYLKPFVDLEGIPAERYQGNSVFVAETEQRYDFTFRWSVVGFGGVGKTINDGENFNTGKLVYNYGTGIRYYLARAFGLRAGLDIAKGPDSWGYYIVFGQSWNK